MADILIAIPVLSVYQYPAEQDAARQAGADDYLGMPFAATDLVTHVQALLAHTGQATR